MKTIYDLIVYGGSITGCLTAVAAAKKGYKVVLVEKKTFLGDNITSGLITGCEEGDNAVIKYKLLEAMERYNINILFMSDLTAVAVNENCAVGAVISNRFGQQLIYARAITDASDFDRAVEMTDNINTWNYNGRCGFCLKYTGDKLPENGTYDVAESIGITNNKATVQSSSDGGLLVNFMFDVNSTNNRYKDLVNWNSKAMRLSVEVNNSLKAVEDLRIIQSSYEVCLVDLHKTTTDSKKYKNVKSVYFNFNPYSGFSQENIEACLDYVNSELDKLSFWDCKGETCEIRSRSIVIPFSECSISRFDDFKMSTECYALKYDYEKFLPVADNTSVLVAGGGTAGTAAALAAATESDNVVIVDENTGFGGTQTFGSVCRYYHGYVKGFALKQEQLVSKSSPVYKKLSYQRQIEESNIRQYTGITICGALCNSREIHGIVAANSDVWGIIKAEVTVDGTGNADLAEFCGIKTQAGAQRDGNLQNYSQSVIERSGLDLDVINHCKYSELLRGIKLAHMQYEFGDFSVMLTPRATRCFEGEYCITLKDILCGYHYEDCIAMARTDSDAHGALSSAIHYMGFVPYHDKIFTLEVPYRACIPKNFSRLIVAGKSLSATPDAISFFRMAADIINRGYAIGLAAAMSVGKDVREVDYPKLKQKLIEVEILPEISEQAEISDEEESKLLKILCSDKSIALDKLKKEYSLTKSVNSAVALAWFGHNDGKDTLINRLKELLTSEEHEYYSDVHPNKPGNNKGGVMGKAEVYWQINRIIAVLALLKEKSCSQIICNALRAFNGGGSYIRDDNEYVYGRIDLQRIPHFDRIRVLCFYIEQCPDSIYVEPLRELLHDKGFGRYVCKENIVGRNYQNSYIELTLVRTLARCGSECGIKMLIDYLEDIHYILSKNAHDELVEISGEDFGYNKSEWINWLNSKYCFELTPYTYENNMF